MRHPLRRTESGRSKPKIGTVRTNGVTIVATGSGARSGLDGTTVATEPDVDVDDNDDADDDDDDAR